MIELDVPAFILTIVVFLALVVYLNKTLYQPLLAFMDAREAAISRDEELANQNLSDVGSEQAKIKEILDKARDEAASIKQSGIDEIKTKASKELKAKADEFEADFETYLEELAQSKDELKKSLREKLPEFKTDIKDRLARI
ncbi:hypothetical protein [Campylobacter geochelonis]|uniref:ATP synthase subunit B n=1 Tax=Campylobacter geochelonis TaxID=1780362 RepID=A0A128EEA8_9BACT|nr:hypothetical protein [Campylobacter geochelonis]QKF70694.1 ATP synthase, F0 complex, b' subunit [Campylobacter geochelonis]CZE45771.1 ATP synthase subunit B [Campylobacter geochelonis]CZE46871.1 ATP synthase subunit B [Campylobacter geochelonis]